MYQAPLRLGVCGLGPVEEVAEVEEVLLAGGALGEGDLTPFGDELLGRHGRYVSEGAAIEGIAPGLRSKVSPLMS